MRWYACLILIISLIIIINNGEKLWIVVNVINVMAEFVDGEWVGIQKSKGTFHL
jgi:hypothetical protein